MLLLCYSMATKFWRALGLLTNILCCQVLGLWGFARRGVALLSGGLLYGLGFRVTGLGIRERGLSESGFKSWGLGFRFLGGGF